jgi:carbon starvation protein CstA
MKQIRINPGVQLLAVAGAVALVGAAIAAQLPELRRYMKIRAM